jgi:methylamine dehydrogenase accessory protein MauD
MPTFFWISYTVLWILIIPLIILNLVLFRQLGIMVMGTARGVNQSGIPIGKKLPTAKTTDLNGREWSTDDLSGKSTVLLFGSPSCKECAEILPEFNKISKDYNIKPILLLFSPEDIAKEYVRKINYNDEVLIVTSELADSLDVQVTPFAYSIDEHGVVRQKGLVNNRDHLKAYAKASKAS